MSKWISKEEVSRLKLYHSTGEKRMVSVASDQPLEVFQISRKAYRIPIFRRDYDSFAFVNMEQNTVDIELLGNVTTDDGVKVEGCVGLQCKIKDDDQYIKRIVVNEGAEERTYEDIVFEVIRKTIASVRWCQLVPVQERVTEMVETMLLEALSKTDSEGELISCFQHRGLTWKEIRPKDKMLADSLENKAKELAEVEHKKELAGIQAEYRTKEKEVEITEAKHRNHIRILEGKLESWMDTRKLVLGKKERDMQKETWQDIKALLETEAGRLAVYPEKQFNYLVDEIKLKLADKNEIMKLHKMFFNHKQAILMGDTRGKINLIEQSIAQHLGLDISDKRKLISDKRKLEDSLTEELEYGDEDEKNNEADNQEGNTEEISDKTSTLNEEETKPE